MTRRVRDFHIKDEPRELLGSLSEIGWRPFAEVYGDELCGQLVRALRTDAVFRQGLVGEMRRAAWWVRNDRWARGQARDEAVALLMEADELMQLAGFLEVDRRALIDCLLHACVCDGCDLSNGVRFGAAFSC